jgi:hypothetical protein
VETGKIELGLRNLALIAQAFDFKGLATAEILENLADASAIRFVFLRLRFVWTR